MTRWATLSITGGLLGLLAVSIPIDTDSLFLLYLRLNLFALASIHLARAVIAACKL